MKWTSHKLLTGTIVFALIGNPISAIIAAAGSIIPDAVEGFPDEQNYNNWRRNHRQLSHWFVPYLLMFLLFQSYNFLYPAPRSFYQLWIVVNGDVINTLPIFTWLIAMLSLGACLHIAEDAVCGKVPGIDRKQKMGIKLFNVGSIKEYVYVLLCSAVLLFIRLKIENVW